MIAQIINTIGTTRVARACGVTPACVSIWKKKDGLPARTGSVEDRRAHYERVIARLAGMPVKELREQLQEESGQSGQ